MSVEKNFAHLFFLALRRISSKETVVTTNHVQAFLIAQSVFLFLFLLAILNARPTVNDMIFIFFAENQNKNPVVRSGFIYL